MTYDISGFGTKINIQSVPSFPQGFTVTTASDDQDFVDSANQTIAEFVMGVNGDGISYSKAVPNPLTIAVVPDSPDDINLASLFSLNKVGKNKISANDLIQAVVTLPSGATTTLINGRIIEGPATSSIASSGRKKTKQYIFKFENYVNTPATA